MKQRLILLLALLLLSSCSVFTDSSCSGKDCTIEKQNKDTNEQTTEKTAPGQSFITYVDSNGEILLYK
ncbi:hypothetical protein EXS74_00480 [Candidatus Woesearchaeota archaeon]|nr:hypothetical protein [Candidatus Woesearchaeota archaeon]